MLLRDQLDRKLQYTLNTFKRYQTNKYQAKMCRLYCLFKAYMAYTFVDFDGSNISVLSPLSLIQYKHQKTLKVKGY